MKILFINHSEQNCGVADYGRRVYAILKQGMDIDYCDGIPNYEGYDTALYNYHYATMPGLMLPAGVKTVGLFHEAHLAVSFDKVIPVAELPRPLYEFTPPALCPHHTPVIGSFGFGFPDKDFPRVCRIVSEQYERAIVRLNIPFAKFGDSDGSLAMWEAEKCHIDLEGTNIELQVSHDYKQPTELLQWLCGNDLNLFLYKPSHGRGISSATDYALSVRRPIGVSNSEMFRRLPASVCVDNTTLADLNVGMLTDVYRENSNERFVNTIYDKLSKD